MNNYSCPQILISVHMERFAKFAYMQIEICTWPQPGANFKNMHMVQILHACANPFTWTDLHRVQIHSHGQICTHEYICIYADLSM